MQTNSRLQLPLLIGFALWLALLGLYLATAATGIVPGDPTEYTFVAHILGIAHPPGYALMTLVTKLWQTVIRLGTVAQRSHWLASAAGAATGALVFGSLWQVGSTLLGSGKRRPDTQPVGRLAIRLPGVVLLPSLFGALSVALAADHWQHSLHVNSHSLTVTLNALALLTLLRWWRTGRDRWLFAFCVVAGLGPTHHPLTVFSFPAYALFIVLVRPGLISFWARPWWRERRWHTLAAMLLFAALGLAILLYYPIRSPMGPEFGPHDMNTPDGFMNVVLARGLRVNLFHFGLGEQGQRLLVFWTLLRQQFSLPVILLAAVGLGWLAIPLPGSTNAAPRRQLLALLGLALAVNLAFVINTVQDVMAYLLTPFMLVGLLAGLGAMAVMGWLARLQMRSSARRWLWGLAWLGLLACPALSLAQNLPRISLRGYQAGDVYVAAVEDRFGGAGEGAVLLNDWEHMTPLWYAGFVENRWPDPADVSPSLVSTARPWVERVYDHLGGGPVYLSGYRREVVETGFRLRPDGPFFRVVEPGDRSMPAGFQPLPALPGEPVELLGYCLAADELPAGGIVSLDLAMRALVTPTDYLVPFAGLGSLTYRFTTDSHLVTPLWRPGEVIVERFAFALPFDIQPGQYPLDLGLANLSQGTESARLPVADLSVTASPAAPRPAVLDGLLANFGQRVGVDRVLVRGGGERRSAVWDEPLTVRPGDQLEVTITWRCLAPVEESYTVFVHLMDAGNRIWDQQDYTPLGGSYPTHLWIPKWLPGQTALDPYRLTVPPDAPPGEYYLEIGLYGMTTRQRVYQHDRLGNLVGDRLVLGPVQVQ